MGSDPIGPNVSGADLRQLRRQLLSAEDQKIHRVLELVDCLEERGEADALIAPLRSRLARLKPRRKVNFTRLLFTPFNPLIVNAPDWSPSSPAIPRTALTILTQQVESSLARQTGNSNPVRLPEIAEDDLGPILEAGRTLWPGAAEALKTSTVPPQWSNETGLREQDYTALSTALQALFPQAARLLELALEAKYGSDPEPEHLLEMLQAVAPAGAHVTAMFIAMGLGWLPRARLFVKVADDFVGARLGNSAAASSAVEFVLTGIEHTSSDSIGLGGIEEMRRAAVLLEDLADTSSNKPGNRDRIEQVRQTVDKACREGFSAEIASQLVEPCLGIAAVDQETAETFEGTARALRKYEGIAKRFGSTDFYDKQLRSAAQALLPKGGEGAVVRVSRIRLIEILRGPDAAAAAMQGAL